MTRRPGLLVVAPAAGAVALVLVVVLAGALFGWRGRPADPEGGPGRHPPRGQAGNAVRGHGSAPIPAGAVVLGPVVRLQAEEEPDASTRAFAPPPRIVGSLQPATVLRVRVDGFEPFARARARQCVQEESRVCRNTVDVQFGEDGSASFQYLATDDFARGTAAGRCGAGAAPCFLVVEAVDGDERAQAQTVFRDPVPSPPRLRVTPSTGLVDGGTVRVDVENLPPGAPAEVVLCAPPHGSGPDRCGRPGPAAPLRVAPDGSGTAVLAVRSGPVGRDRVFCGHGAPCGVSVVSEALTRRPSVVPVRFATPPGAGVSPVRLVAGLGVAALLFGIAVWLIRRTDWSPIGEEAAPEIDNAEYADLDAIVAALPPEPDIDELLHATR